MKSIYLKCSFVLLIVNCIIGCTKNFVKINTDPNNPSMSQGNPRLVLSTIESRSMLPATDYQNTQLLNPDIYAEYYANDLGPVYNSYNQVDMGINLFWDNYVYYFANNLNLIITGYSDNADYTNIVQMARIWKCWLFLRATDIWGDIPYFNASNGSTTPAAYDKQQDIYNDMFSVLTDAVTKFDDSKINPAAQDMVFGGNNGLWIKFANSLRLRMAMRISSVDPATAQNEAESAIAAGVISSVNDRAAIQCDASYYYAQNPIANVFGEGGFGMSLTMWNILANLGGQPWPASVDATGNPAMVDPRGPLMFDPSTTTGKWSGSTPGLAVWNNSQTNTDVARIGAFVNSNLARPFYIFKYSEICFLIAEAKVRFPSWNTGGGTAQSWYEAGIQDNMAEWGISSPVVTAYLASAQANINGTSVSYTDNTGNNNTALDKIITQKWLSLFPENSWEAWNDHRRLQKPVFIPFQSVNSQWFPGTYDGTNVPQNYIRRVAYPVEEQTLNQTNLNQALTQQGMQAGTYIGYVRTPMWWDPYNADGTLK
ncbi:MAG: SusD/RagB family nutrient-binding outer membrane lipoprotein [Chitinophagaceae bacterium]|jgi:hypothetical protein|nr:SusD/RagB family nutrient-binding outer membrane lipoprotein [Chitinophagaceae bacterium]